MSGREKRVLAMLGLPTFGLALAITATTTYVPLLAKRFTSSTMVIGMVIAAEGLVAVLTLEPSCGAVFRNELTNMLPNDEDAKRLSRQTLTLGELLALEAPEWELPRLERKAMVHFHCHQRATSDTDRDREVLDRMGLDYEVLDTGCCGLAGSFGYEHGERYEVSVKAGERLLLPRVREASASTLVLTDGFSCHSQINHGSGRGALHMAQVIQMALRDGPNGPATSPPEARSYPAGLWRRRSRDGFAAPRA